MACPSLNKQHAESAYKRHVSYCRRTQTRQRIRKRACRACNSAKAKCDFEQPCQRCMVNGRLCSYDGADNVAKATERRALLASATAHAHNSETVRSRTVDDFNHAPQTVDAFESSFFESDWNTEWSSLAPTNEEVFISVHDRNNHLGVFCKPQNKNTMPSSQQTPSNSSILSPQILSTWQSSISSIHDTSLSSATSRLQRGNAILSCNFQLIGSLSRLRPSDPVSLHNARLIMHSLRAYPYMMLSRETFPPFIHPNWRCQNAKALPWPVANCMSISTLFVSRSTDTETFLWQAVKRDCQRCLDEVRLLQFFIYNCLH